MVRLFVLCCAMNTFKSSRYLTIVKTDKQLSINGSPQVFQYPFDKQECDGTLELPWKNNYTVALTTSSNPIMILGELVMVEGYLTTSCFSLFLGDKTLATFRWDRMVYIL